MSKYRCRVTSMIGRRGTTVTLPDNQRTKELVQRKVVEPVTEAKGGKTVKDADPKAETKAKAKGGKTDAEQ